MAYSENRKKGLGRVKHLGGEGRNIKPKYKAGWYYALPATQFEYESDMHWVGPFPSRYRANVELDRQLAMLQEAISA